MRYCLIRSTSAIITVRARWIYQHTVRSDSECRFQVLTKAPARLPRDKMTTFEAHTPFMSTNSTVANAAWDAVDTNAVALAISRERAHEMGLPPTLPFPWDHSKGMYFIRGYHYLHGLVRSSVSI